MTDKPMDVERTLLELETKWRERGDQFAQDPTGGSSHVEGMRLQLCADELKAVREALREPGELSVEQVHPEIQKLAKKIGDEFCGGSETVMDIIEAELCSFVYLSCTPAGRASKQEPGAEAAPPLCVICGKREEMHGASNQCNLDEEFSPRWTPPRDGGRHAMKAARVRSRYCRKVIVKDTAGRGWRHGETGPYLCSQTYATPARLQPAGKRGKR